MERQKSSTERASPTGSAQCLIFSRRRSYIPAAVPVSIMSSDVFVQQLFPVFPAYSAMDSDLRLEVGEEPLKGVVGVGEASLRMVVESPQERHVALDPQIGAPQSLRPSLPGGWKTRIAATDRFIANRRNFGGVRCGARTHDT